MKIFFAYLGIFFGVIIEGEAVIIAGAIAAQQGHLNIVLVAACAFFGTLTADWMYYFLGKSKGRKYLRKHHKLHGKFERINLWIYKWKFPVMFGYRFLYGFRIITPFALGMGRIKTSTFIAYSVTGTTLWVLLFTSLGYHFGNVIDELSLNTGQKVTIIIVAIVFIGFLFFAVPRFRKRKKT